MPKVMYTPEWMPLKEAAARLSCDRKTILARLTRGDLNVRIIRLNTAMRVHRGDFEEALRAMAISSSS